MFISYLDDRKGNIPLSFVCTADMVEYKHRIQNDPESQRYSPEEDEAK